MKRAFRVGLLLGAASWATLAWLAFVWRRRPGWHPLPEWDRRSGGATVVMMVLLFTGCEDLPAGPGAGPVIESASPQVLVPGTVAEIRGTGLGDVDLLLDDSPIVPFERDHGSLRFRVPEEARPCDAGPYGAWLRVESALGADSVELARSGDPLELDLSRSEHRVARLAGSCALRIAQAGTYGAAVFTLASGSAFDPDQPRRDLQVTLLDAAPGDALEAVQTTRAPMSRPTPQAVSDARKDVAVATCSKPVPKKGDRLTLGRPFVGGEETYVVVAVSEHFSVLVEADSLAAYTPARRTTAEGLAEAAEERAYPYLRRVFGEWPDVDGQGRLDIIVGSGSGASYSGQSGFYLDGCPGDFVEFGHSLLDVPLQADVNNPVGILVHEALHWYDITDLVRQISLPAWTIEGFATLGRRLWTRLERYGNPWIDIEPCPPGATCDRVFLQDDRYGGAGLEREGGYAHGSYLLEYLLAQAAPAGREPEALGALRERDRYGRGLGLRPLFELMGGSGRSEEELQGEFLLTFYADGHVEGASLRLDLPAWNVADSGSRYPLRSARLVPPDLGPDRVDLSLARPDGMVIEVQARQGAVLTFTPAVAGLAVALVRGS